jgi:competence protein ComEA
MIRSLITCILAAFAFSAYAAVDVNKATLAELDGIKGIGPNMSERIVEERKNGDFKNWADLVTRVKGVGAANAARFSTGGLTVNGSAYSDVAAAKAEGKTGATATTATPSAARTASKN